MNVWTLGDCTNRKSEENEFKLQIPVITSGRESFQNLTSGLSGYHQNEQNQISGGVSWNIFQIWSHSVPINVYLVVIGSVEPVGSATVKSQFESPNLEKFVKFNETIAIVIENVEHKARNLVAEKIPV